MSAGDGETLNAGGATSGAGKRLAVAREAAGLSVADVAAQTRIPIRHLAAIEAGTYAGLPGRSYAIGFAKTYARAVGEDETAIAAAVSAEFSANAPSAPVAFTPVFTPGDPARVPSSRFAWVAAGALAVLAVGGYVWWDRGQSASEALPSLIPEETPQPAVSEAASVAAPVANGPVVFTAQVDKLWVKFYDGAGKQLLQKQLNLGESFTVPAEAVEPKLWTGRPDALTITVGGQAVPKISEKQEKVKDVPVSAQALLARAKPAAVVSAVVAAPTGPVAMPSVATPTPRAAFRPKPRVRRASPQGGVGEAAAAQRALNESAAPSAAAANPSTAPQ